jgi:hypothetical protein
MFIDVHHRGDRSRRTSDRGGQLQAPAAGGRPLNP